MKYYRYSILEIFTLIFNVFQKENVLDLEGIGFKYRGYDVIEIYKSTNQGLVFIYYDRHTFKSLNDMSCEDFKDYDLIKLIFKLAKK